VKCSCGKSARGGSEYCAAPNSSSDSSTSTGSSWLMMPFTASSVRPRDARSTCPPGVTTYGLSPACMTSASPSTWTIA
jgi:hypothetical protein